MDIQTETSIRGKRAKELFYEGYNCSQSVVLAFEDLLPMDHETLAKMSSSFGGGMGRLREVCGGVSGMFIVAGILYGYDGPKDYEGKKKHYERIQYLAHEYEKINGSIVCRDLLGLPNGKDIAAPEKRSREYYEKRPCPNLVAVAAAILEKYIEEHPVSSEDSKKINT